MNDVERPAVVFHALNNQHVPTVDGFLSTPGKAQTSLPKYTYIHYLAHGASGSTYTIVRNADKRIFALKATCLDTLSAAERLRQESEVVCMSCVNHFACVRLCESLMTDRFLFLVMEYCDGGDLSFQISMMRVQRMDSLGESSRTAQCVGFDEDTLKYVALQLLLGLHHMHIQCHMLHRDLKPRNVLTTTTGLVKIGDFGFSKSYGTMKDDIARTFCGTPWYIAPEVWSKKPYGRPADMWSLGILLYECMTTTVPFNSQNMEELRQSILEDEPQLIVANTYSKELRDMVTALLNKEPSARPDTTALLNTPYIRSALLTFREALSNCPIVDLVMAQAEAALQPVPIYRINASVSFESPVRKFKATTQKWVSRYLILRDGELRLERPRRRQLSDTALSTLSSPSTIHASQTSPHSGDGSRTSTFGSLMLPLPGAMPPLAELPPAALTQLQKPTVSPSAASRTRSHREEPLAAAALFSPALSPQAEAWSLSASPSSAGARLGKPSFKVSEIDSLQRLNEYSLALRLLDNECIFFETEQAAEWERALRECLGWPTSASST